MQCLQKAGKTANGILDTPAQTALLIEILNQYVYYYEAGAETVCLSLIVHYLNVCANSFDRAQLQIALLSKLASLIKSNIAKLESNDDNAQLFKYFENTLNHIAYAKGVLLIRLSSSIISWQHTAIRAMPSLTLTRSSLVPYFVIVARIEALSFYWCDLEL